MERIQRLIILSLTKSDMLYFDKDVNKPNKKNKKAQ